ncbi:MAG: flagellar hook assembly protein FlgD [Burkholderiales bacterium]|nr:flagellar hook assembly protein FlgD [Burkholderiales bacterium]
MVSSVSNSTPVNAGSALKSAGQTTADQQQDRFLKLLVAQLNNQDPTNPLDNAQITSQMAQINTVSGINQLNETIKSMAAQFNSMQVLQGTSLIGRDVLMKSNTLSISDGKTKGAIDLAGDASSVNVQILSPGGQVLDTLNLGPQSAGRRSFVWDASSYKGTASPTFKVVATNGKTAVDATALAQDTITSVGTNGTSMNLQLKGRAAIAYDAVQSVL